MRTILQRLNIGITCLFLCVALSAQNDSNQLHINHGPYLIEPGMDCMTIMWSTNKACQSWVEYCGDTNLGVFPKWGGYPEKAYPGNNGLLDANTKLHSVRLTNLKPGTKYRYRVMSKEILQYNPYEVIFGDTAAGEILEFETLSPESKNFSFSVVSDIHERADALEKLIQLAPLDSMDMMFYAGDMLNWIGGEERIFKGFIDVSVDGFAKEKPMILARGNHETRGPNARDLFSYFPHSSGHYYYAFTQGDVRFIILDGGEDKPDDHPVYAGLVDFDNYRSDQAEWLKNEVKSEAFIAAKYKIVMCHIPPFSKSKAHGSTDLTNKWGSILNASGVDLIISGHHHRYSKIDENTGDNNMPVLILGTDMICNAKVSDALLRLEIKAIDGKEVDELIIK